jgi:hypothetical protein
MQVARQCVVEILRMAALPEVAEEAHRVLHDPVEYNRFLTPVRPHPRRAD